jgi:hypothetical protein
VSRKHRDFGRASHRQQPALHVDVADEIGHLPGPLDLAFFKHIDPVADDLGEVNVLLG